MAEVYLKCRWGNGELYLPAENVAGISSQPQVTFCPTARTGSFRGIAQYEGAAVPVFDCSLSREAGGETEGLSVVFLELPEARIGLVMSEVLDFVRPEAGDFDSEQVVVVDNFEARLIDFINELSPRSLETGVMEDG